MRVWLALALVGCSFHSNSGSNNDAAAVAVDAPPMFDDAGHELRKIIFDTAASWNDVGAEMFDTSVDPWGSITQAGFAYGGLIAHGSTMKLWDPADLDADLTWEPAVSGATPVGVGLWPGKNINNGDNLGQFGITNAGGTFSMWVEGEIQLAAGSNALAFAAGEIGFLDIAPPHTHDFTQVATSRGGGVTAATYTAAAAGWYPFRIGLTHTANNYTLQLQIANRGILRTDIRTRGDQVRGLMRTVFDHQMIGTGAVATVAQVDENDAINTNFAALPPGAPGNDNWSARWAGQVYVMLPGAFQFQATSDDGNAMSIAGSNVTADHWDYGDGHAGSQTKVTATLDPGWRDIVLDYNQVNSDKNMSLIVASGPELAGGTWPKARLRSVEPRGNRLVTAANLTDATIHDNSTSMGGVSMVTLAGYTNEAPTQLDMLVPVNDSHNDQLKFVVTNPAGATMTVNPTNNPGNGDQVFHFTVTSQALLGTTVSGNWTMTVTDTSSSGGGGDSTLEGFYVTMHTQNGLDQIAPQGVWRWTGDLTTSVASIDDIDWAERVPSGGTAAMVQIRSCDMDKCADNPPWSDALVRHMAPAIAMKRYLQIQVTLISDGTSESEVDSLTLAYRRNL